jgi:hypothetical protein
MVGNEQVGTDIIAKVLRHLFKQVFALIVSSMTSVWAAYVKGSKRSCSSIRRLRYMALAFAFLWEFVEYLR